ncbi:unnamed protein product [Bursaphelenchus okinawaensis]|uniref:Uncharacterized protein n=1 Tax=Bursaphelenchus okinawaensis TaxID=465554 RepID=A0A811K684_9BILA|nr:unnamed protein product [Bursaphelenchus okinawaensis]CAG9093725.1 unnamed protein product [Bursaphelenchus okinawaensis]
MATDPRLRKKVVTNSHVLEKLENEIKYAAEYNVTTNLFELKSWDPRQIIRKYKLNIRTSDGADLMGKIAEGSWKSKSIRDIRNLFNEFTYAGKELFHCDTDFIVYNNIDTFYTLRPMDPNVNDCVSLRRSVTTDILFDLKKHENVVCQPVFEREVDATEDKDEYFEFLKLLVYQNFWDTCKDNYIMKSDLTFFTDLKEQRDDELCYSLGGFRVQVAEATQHKYLLRLAPVKQYFLGISSFFGLLLRAAKVEEIGETFVKWVLDKKHVLNQIFKDMKATDWLTEEPFVFDDIERQSVVETYDGGCTVHERYKKLGANVFSMLPVVKGKDGSYHAMDAVEISSYHIFDSRLADFVLMQRNFKARMEVFDRVVEKKVLFQKNIISEIGYLTKFKFAIDSRLMSKAQQMFLPSLEFPDRVVALKDNTTRFDLDIDKIRFLKSGQPVGFRWAIVNFSCGKTEGFDDKQIRILSSFLFFENNRRIPPKELHKRIPVGKEFSIASEVFEELKRYDFIMYSDIRSRKLNHIMAFYEAAKGIATIGVDPLHVIKRQDAHRKWKPPIKYAANTKLGGLNFTIHRPVPSQDSKDIDFSNVFANDRKRQFVAIDVEHLDETLYVLAVTYTTNNNFRLKGEYSYEDDRIPSRLYVLLGNAIDEYGDVKDEKLACMPPDEVVILVKEPVKDRVSEALEQPNLKRFKFTVITVKSDSEFVFLKYKSEAVEKGSVFENLPHAMYAQVTDIPGFPKFFLKTVDSAHDQRQSFIEAWDEYTVVRTDTNTHLQLLGYLVFNLCFLDPVQLRLTRYPFVLMAAQHYLKRGAQNYRCVRDLHQEKQINIRDNPFDPNLDLNSKIAKLKHFLKPRLETYFCCNE